MKMLWPIIERIFLKISLQRLEKEIGRDFDQELSYRIDAVRFLLEG